jgi:hypothetical protein
MHRLKPRRVRDSRDLNADEAVDFLGKPFGVADLPLLENQESPAFAIFLLLACILLSAMWKSLIAVREMHSNDWPRLFDLPVCLGVARV